MMIWLMLIGGSWFTCEMVIINFILIWFDTCEMAVDLVVMMINFIFITYILYNIIRMTIGVNKSPLAGREG